MTVPMFIQLAGVDVQIKMGRVNVSSQHYNVDLSAAEVAMKDQWHSAKNTCVAAITIQRISILTMQLKCCFYTFRYSKHVKR